MSRATLQGVTLTENLPWSDHDHKVVCKANRTICLLRYNIWSYKSNIKEIAYMSLVRPQLEYASSMWDPYHQDEVRDIVTVQRRAARFVCEDTHREEGVVSSLLSKLGWLTLEERWKASRLTLLYKIVYKHVAVDTGHLLKTAVHNTRSNTSTAPTIINISTSRLLPIFLLPRTKADWNLLTSHVRSADSMDLFKKLLHDHKPPVLDWYFPLRHAPHISQWNLRVNI